MITFLSLFRGYITHYEASTDKFEKRSYNTIRAYSVKYKLVNQFLIDKSLVYIPAESFDIDISRALGDWMAEKKKKDGSDFYVHNYMARVREICRAVLNYGVLNKLISKNPLHHLRIKKTPPKKPPYITLQKIQEINEYVPKGQTKVKAFMMFLIQLNSGFDYGDFAELNRSHKVTHQGRDYIVKPRNKNGNEAIIPISTQLDRILEGFDYKIRLLSNAKYNEALKLIAKDLSIDIPLTTKDVRKLFLMNKLNNEGYSMEAVSRMAGHNNISTTQKYYAQPNINLISRELDRLNNGKQN